MRVGGVLAVVILTVAAWVVPLPLQVVDPGRFVAAADAVDVVISEQFIADAALRLEPIDGTFLGVRQLAGPTLMQTVTAAVSPARQVVPDRSVAQRELQRPEVVAAVQGLGLSPTRMEDTPLPVTVQVAEQLDPASLGAVLHAFDATSALDVARGRRVLGIGVVAADQSLTCPTTAGTSVSAAHEARIDVVLVPAACGWVSAPPALRVVTVGTLTEALDTLLGRP